MEPEISLPLSQKPDTFPYAERYQSTPRPLNLFNIHLHPIYANSSKCPLFDSGFLTESQPATLLFPICPANLIFLNLISRKILGKGYKF
jgi:hypothetical protein